MNTLILIFAFAFVFVVPALYFTIESALFADSFMEKMTWWCVVVGILLLLYSVVMEVY